MKSLYFFFVFAFIFGATQSCVKAQEQSFAFDHPSTPVFFDYTSTGCPSCGRWGRPNSEAILALHGDKVNHVAVHIRFNDPMESPLTTTLGQNRPGRKFTPQFWVNAQQATYLNEEGYLDSTKTFDNAAAYIMNAYDTPDVPALDGVVSRSNGKIMVDYGVRFYEDTNMNASYFIGCYLMQDGVMAPQKGANPGNVAHNSVLTASTEGVYGKAIPMSSVGVKTFSDELDASTVSGDKSYVLLILWKKNGVQYDAVNSLKID